MLDTSKPTDQVMVSELPEYIREDRVAINAVSSSGNVGSTNLTIPAGTTTLTVGSEVGSFGYETIVVDAAAAVNISKILGGTEGQVKVFIFQDNNISIVDGAASGGNFYLNHLPALSSFAAQINDILAVVNIGGDGGTTYGYWKELYRTLAIK